MLRSLSGALWTLYGACALAVFGLLFVVAAILVLALPRLEWRRSLVRLLARVALAIFGLRLTAHDGHGQNVALCAAGCRDQLDAQPVAFAHARFFRVQQERRRIIGFLSC